MDIAINLGVSLLIVVGLVWFVLRTIKFVLFEHTEYNRASNTDIRRWKEERRKPIVVQETPVQHLPEAMAAPALPEATEAPVSITDIAVVGENK